MADVRAEVECKLDVPKGFALPDLSRFGTVAGDDVRLVSTYLDTAGRALFGSRITLRRRDGAVDAGWQLKVPGRGSRTEIRLPLADSLPAELCQLVEPFLGGDPIEPSIRLETDRARRRISTPDGRLIAEVVLDDVRAVEPATARWREAEVELGEAGSRADLDRIVAALTDAGAAASARRSKLARAVQYNEPSWPAKTAAAVLADYLSTQADAIVAGHFAICRDEPDSVHQTRVACRRIRSVTRVFAGCFDPEQVRRFERDLRWWAGVLGAVRDREVMRERLVDAVRALPDQLVIGPVEQRIDRRLGEEIAHARSTVLEEMGRPRYAGLVAELRRWRDDPPFTPATGRPARVLRRDLRRAAGVLDKRLDRALPDGPDTDLHRARKAAKRLRYAAEAARGTPKGLKKLQKLLGEYQDGIVAMHTLLGLAAEDGFTYGVLLAQERAAADAVRRRLAKRR